ncbi:MAG: flagellar basal body-associated FliL family protein [Pseudomonadota bacterium]|nr:flagellar basal body-associated FliL family protein [Pseudomonadota bacterium]
MSAGKDSEQTQAAAPSGGGMMTFVAIGLVSAAASFGAVFFLAPSGQAEVATCAPAAHSADFTPDPLAREDHAYVELDEILITVGNEPASRFVKIKTAIVADKNDADAVKKAQPMLTDAFISYLRSVELTDFESASFYPRLREQLSRRAEVVLGGEVSRGVLVTEFLLR